MEEVQVSILCIAYNHGRYIRQCLEGFVAQKDVTFEIIIHDDASTDDTADIIREYDKRYPHLFKTILQKENQYSQNKPFVKQYMLPLVTGKYVAICEGDDYWVDTLKLKKQCEALESHPDCFMCGHKVQVVDESGEKVLKYQPNEEIKTGVLAAPYYFKNYKNTWGIHTSSFFFDAKKYLDYVLNPPKFRRVSPVGDITELLYFIYIGNIYYINDIMSNYRFMSIGSWTYENFNSKEKEKRREEITTKMRMMFLEYCKYTDNRYRAELEFKIQEYNAEVFFYLVRDKKYKELFETFSQKELRELGLINKDILKMRMYICFPRIMQLYDRIKNG